MPCPRIWQALWVRGALSLSLSMGGCRTQSTNQQTNTSLRVREARKQVTNVEYDLVSGPDESNGRKDETGRVVTRHCGCVVDVLTPERRSKVALRASSLGVVKRRSGDWICYSTRAA